MVTTFLAALVLKPTLAIFVPLFAMIISDLLIGNSIFVGDQMNRIVLFTYSGFVMIGLINILKRDKIREKLGEFKLKNAGIAAGLGIGFVLIYDVWTNIGGWYLMYPHTISSLTSVFTAGVPFMMYHLISGVITFIAIALPIMVYTSKEHKIEMPIKIKTIHKIPVAVIAICLIAMSFTGTASHLPEKNDARLMILDETSVTIEIKGDGWTFTDNIYIEEEETVYNLLVQISNRNNFKIESTFYEQFDSLLIDSINEDENGKGDKYWQYYVNEEIPMIGCDKYIVSNGDHIVWSYEIISY